MATGHRGHDRIRARPRRQRRSARNRCRRTDPARFRENRSWKHSLAGRRSARCRCLRAASPGGSTAPRLAGPSVIGLSPPGDIDRFLPPDHGPHELAVAVDDERATVKDQLVLPANPVDVGERTPGLTGAIARELEPGRKLSRLERRAVRHKKELGARISAGEP